MTGPGTRKGPWAASNAGHQLSESATSIRCRPCAEVFEVQLPARSTRPFDPDPMIRPTIVFFVPMARGCKPKSSLFASVAPILAPSPLLERSGIPQ